MYINNYIFMISFYHIFIHKIVRYLYNKILSFEWIIAQIFLNDFIEYLVIITIFELLICRRKRHKIAITFGTKWRKYHEAVYYIPRRRRSKIFSFYFWQFSINNHFFFISADSNARIISNIIFYILRFIFPNP